jgi:Glucodextranase, domain B/FecR protein
MPPKKQRASYITYVAVTYKSVFLSILGLAALAAGVSWVMFPQASHQVLDSANALVNRIGGNTAQYATGSKNVGQQQAHFTNLDGVVRVKKGNANTWAKADYNLPLEKGDVIQTSGEGMAKVVFADGSSYTIKPDSLIVVEDNSTNSAQQTQVAVQVTTGMVDLATSTYSTGSKSQVIVAGATATIAPESSAQVKNDPKNDQHEILVKKGSGEIARNGEVVRIGSYEKVSFKSDAPQMTKEQTVGAPTLISPANLLPVQAHELEFSWTPMDRVKSYRIQISRNPYFSQVLLDKTVNSPVTLVSGLSEGTYYWSVRSVDGQGRTSVESERNKFTVVPKGSDAGLALQLDPFVSHGHVIEVRGKTDPSARVMVNGEEVPVIGGDGSFHYYTPPLPAGENMITITAQNNRGGMNTQTKKIVVQ